MLPLQVEVCGKFIVVFKMQSAQLGKAQPVTQPPLAVDQVSRSVRPISAKLGLPPVRKKRLYNHIFQHNFDKIRKTMLMLKRHNQTKIRKKSVILFWLLNMTI